MVTVEENGDESKNLEPEEFRKLFIGGLTSTTTEDTLREFFSKFGTLVDVVVMRDPSTKRSRGFGFVTFSEQSEIDDAMKSRPHIIDGKTVDPKRAVPRDQSQRSEVTVSSKRLYVSGIRDEHTEDMLKEYFSKYGPINKCEIIADKNNGKPRGFAFVSFDDYDPVDKCVLLKSHIINNYRCDVKKALSKEEMSKAQQQERERMDRGSRSRGAPAGGRGGGSWGGSGDDRSGYGSNQSWGGQSGYGGAQGGGGSWGASGGTGYGSGGYGGGAPGAGRGWNNANGGWGGPPATTAPPAGGGNWGPQGTGANAWAGPTGGQGGQWNQASGNAQSWGGGQGTWSGRGY